MHERILSPRRPLSLPYPAEAQCAGPLTRAFCGSVAGAIKQLTGSYASVFRVSSGIYLLGALVYCLTPRGCFIDQYRSCRRRRRRRQGDDEKKLPV